MNALTSKVLIAVAPVLGTCLGIAILRAARLPFPPELALDAWAQWVVFAAVVYTFAALFMFVIERFVSARPIDGSDRARRSA